MEGPTEGRIHARSEVDVSAALAHVARLREDTGVRVTLTHLVGAALGRALRAVPEARARVVLGRIRPLEDCTVSFAVDIEDGVDLGPVRVPDADRLSTVEIARRLQSAVDALRGGRDRHHRSSSALVRIAPRATMRPILSAASVLVGGLGVPAFGQPGRPFGTAFVSNVGTLGLDEAYLAPVPFARTAVYLAVGAVADRPVVVDGQVVVRPVSVLVATADHRILDGAHAGRLQRVVTDLLADPERLDRPAA
ncbi:2-oxo acid dehydrogenase subunit E2 [Phycicoccus flavus]|uniref:2-oxo acid dehydrogenase subunit E2 n=1 Tax=Phycicoccus flavus TaxID=2502783 RepID=A0A8T6R6Q1_9MICO|nr:2-oxo acid dehydrogenase subunit E2 [Phycicoccus flavus]NHA69314.1 2-oxo acid dehydrogenase subunit E2 [Phycicoccus flavus]